MPTGDSPPNQTELLSWPLSFPNHVAGVDEVGRGTLAGPVCAAAVVLGRCRTKGLDDSKRLSPARRAELAKRIRTTALDWSLGWAGVGEIDTYNIAQASLLAMRRAIAGLRCPPGLVLVDGNLHPYTSLRRVPADLLDVATSGTPQVRCEVGGDARFACISAASIVAKQARDRYMRWCHLRYPGYGFDRHVGYGTKVHLQALATLGALPLHRQSFAPVARAEQVRGAGARHTSGHHPAPARGF